MNLSNQEIFNRVIAHIAVQGFGTTDKGSCAYRSPEGRSCGVGMWLDDKSAALLDDGPKIEGLGASTLDGIAMALEEYERDERHDVHGEFAPETYNQIKAIIDGLPGEDNRLDLHIAIQQAHDKTAVREWGFADFLIEMRQIAEDFNLTMPKGADA